MIVLEHVEKCYAGKKVIEDFSLTVPERNIFGFLGQNGAGKTTIMKMIVGLTLPNAGTITIGGKSSNDLSMREEIGFMPESPSFYDRLTGFEFLTFCSELFHRHKRKSEEEFNELLKQVGIYGAANNPIGTYSKGMRQRLAFAQALVNDPRYLFLDEPLDGLDPVGRKEVKTMIKALKAEGRSIFFNSHILYDIEELCDEMGIVHEGKLLYAGSVKGFSKGKSLEDKFISMIEGFSREEQ